MESRLLFAERFLIRSDGPTQSENHLTYDEVRSISLIDGHPAVEMPAEVAASQRVSSGARATRLTSTTTQTFVRDESPADQDHHAAWAETATDVKGPANGNDRDHDQAWAETTTGVRSPGSPDDRDAQEAWLFTQTKLGGPNSPVDRDE